MKAYKYCYWERDADWSLAHWTENAVHQFQVGKLIFGWVLPSCLPDCPGCGYPSGSHWKDMPEDYERTIMIPEYEE